jgi:hypothetical protein
MDTFIFILKVLVPSLVLSIAIKYLAPFFAIAPTPINVLIAVVLPSIIVAIVLLAQRPHSPSR